MTNPDDVERYEEWYSHVEAYSRSRVVNNDRGLRGANRL